VRLYLKEAPHKNRDGGVTQGEGPEFKFQYHKKKKKKTKNKEMHWLKSCFSGSHFSSPVFTTERKLL
jgi:hypothetical protein